MTDPEITADPPWDGAAPPWAPNAAQDPVTAYDPGVAQAPAAVTHRRRRRWVLFTLAAVLAMAGLAAGMVAWAPWVPPPVLRPAGLMAGPATANSITFRWSPPLTGPLPDKYLILNDGTVAGSVAGTATSYRQAGLTPATRYQYRVVAVRGGTRSPQSAILAVSTLTPPLSQARLQGTWTVNVKYLQRLFGISNETLIWDVSPLCAAGACGAMLYAVMSGKQFSMKLTRAGAVYGGRTVLSFTGCAGAGITFPDPTTVTIRVRATAAAGQGQVWAATSLAGTMAGTSQYVSKYVSNGVYYCPAASFKATLSGTSA